MTSRTESFLLPREDLTEEVAALRLRLAQVERTLSAVARESIGASIAGPCPRCQQSMLLATSQTLECPACSYRRSL